MTNEQWERIKPFAEADAAATQSYQNWCIGNQPLDIRERVESYALGMRLQHEMAEVACAYYMALKKEGLIP